MLNLGKKINRNVGRNYGIICYLETNEIKRQMLQRHISSSWAGLPKIRVWDGFYSQSLKGF